MHYGELKGTQEQFQEESGFEGQATETSNSLSVSVIGKTHPETTDTWRGEEPPPEFSELASILHTTT